MCTLDALPDRNAGYLSEARVDEREFRRLIIDCFRARLRASPKHTAPSPDATWAEAAAAVARTTRSEARRMPSEDEFRTYFDNVQWAFRYALTNAYECTTPSDSSVPAVDVGSDTEPSQTSDAAHFARMRDESVAAARE